MALIEWLPTLKLAVLNVAWPLLATERDPRIVVPSWNVTIPPGTPDAGDTTPTTAVSVTALPKLDGLGADCSAVAVDPFTTVSP